MRWFAAWRTKVLVNPIVRFIKGGLQILQFLFMEDRIRLFMQHQLNRRNLWERKIIFLNILVGYIFIIILLDIICWHEVALCTRWSCSNLATERHASNICTHHACKFRKIIYQAGPHHMEEVEFFFTYRSIIKQNRGKSSIELSNTSRWSTRLASLGSLTWRNCRGSVQSMWTWVNFSMTFLLEWHVSHMVAHEATIVILHVFMLYIRRSVLNVRARKTGLFHKTVSIAIYSKFRNFHPPTTPLHDGMRS